MSHTLSTTHWPIRGAPSAEDSSHPDAPQSATGNLSCLWPLNFTTPPLECQTPSLSVISDLKQGL